MKSISITVFILLVVFACSLNRKEQKETVGKPDYIFENLDTTTDPGHDFFQYANGGWVKKNPIPNDQASWGIGHLVLEENMRRLRER